jgi:L-iditol 2-dehydrogenase
MRVAMYYNNKDVRIEEIPKPEISEREILVKVIASGICGTDVLEWYRIKRAPLVLGHEIAGEIVEVGKEGKNYRVGDRVFVAHHVPCNTCRYCLAGNHTVCETLHTTNYYPGGFSEYIRVPEINVDRGTFLLPPEISFEEGTFIEPLACVIRAQRMTHLQVGQSILILGAGVSGLLQLLALQAQGIKQVIITDVNAERLRLAKEWGALAAIDANEDIASGLRRANKERLADLVIVCTGALSAFKQALECVDRAGTILFFAAPPPQTTVGIPVTDFWRKSIKIMHSYGGAPLDTILAIEMLRQGSVPVKKMITHQLRLNEAGLGFKLVAEAKACLKVILAPHQK